MSNYSSSEENYLKVIFQLSQTNEIVSTGIIAKEMQAKDSSVTDMIKKLDKKGAISYVKYKGVTMTPSGEKNALKILRKHRLWEVFLVEKLKFKWDEVHEIAEQLEHIKSPVLIDRLDDFLGFPKVDPHGDPIPDGEGNMHAKPNFLLSVADLDQKLQIVRVKDDSSDFLQYLDSSGLFIGVRLCVKQKITFDDSLELILEESKTIHISSKVAANILVVET